MGSWRISSHSRASVRMVSSVKRGQKIAKKESRREASQEWRNEPESDV